MSPENKNNTLEDVLANISDAFISLDLDFTVTYINKLAENFSGREKKKIIGKNFLEAYPKSSNTVFQEIYLQIVDEKGSTPREKFEFEAFFDEPPFKNWYNVRVFSNKNGFNIFFQDITSRKAAELELKESEEKCKSLLETIPNSTERERQWSNLISNLPGMVYHCLNDKEWTMTFISHQCKEITGYDSSDIINNSKKAYNDLIFEDDREHVWSTVQNALEKSEPYETTYRIVTRQNEIKWVWERGVGVEDENGELSLEGFIEDINDQKLAEEALKESEEKYRALFESDPNYTILLGLDGYLLDVNPAATMITGLSKKELVGKHFIDLTIFPEEELVSHREIFSHFVTGKTIAPYESRIYDYNGKIRWIEIKQSPIRIHGEITHVLLICSDITQRKKAENKIKESLKEKEVLLQEIHHRVKNNMQIVSSLLNLQKQYVDEEETVNILMESQNRVKSMAMIHEKLYQSHNLTSINIFDYVQSLVKDLFASYSTPASQITPIIEIDNVNLNIETAVPCGLIINELVSNSLKYAFPQGRGGKIILSLKLRGKYYELIISDNGIGFPEDLDFKNTESLGLQLVNSLVGQINGEIELNRSQGTMFKIIFSKLTYKERI
ncbi:MAG: PAS domain S-box protein [Methanobacterium formicicum]